MSTESMRDRFGRVAADLVERDERVAIVLAEIGSPALSTALKRHPGRAVNVGIREQLMIGVTAGFSLAGFRPIAFSYAPFVVERPFEQIKLDLGHNDLDAVLVSTGASFDASTEGRTHQAPEDVALMSTLPGWRIAVPGHPDEAEAELRRAVASGGRTYIRLSSRINRQPVDLPAGGMAVMRRGSRGTVIAVGPMLDPVLEATGGIDVTVVYATIAQPLDGATLREAVSTPAVVVVEPYLEGTTTPAIAERLRAVPSRILAIGVPRREYRRYGDPADHAAAHGLDAAGIAGRVLPFLDGYVA